MRPLTVAEMWAALWRRFNHTSPIAIPQLIVLDEQGLREEVYSEIHPVSILLASESSTPVADRRWLNVNNKYIGVLTLADKPGGWQDKESQLRYLWEVLAKEQVYDTEIICQLSKGNQRIIRERVQSVAKQANVALEEAKRRKDVDVHSQIKLKQAIAAQSALYQNQIALSVGVVFLVHRSTREKLDSACKYLQAQFLRPAWLNREVTYPWRTWLQTFPICWQKLLAKPFERRRTYKNGEAPGVMPLVKTATGDATGFELIASEGGTPIYLDLERQHRHLGIFGTTRSGKSLLSGGLITQGLVRGLPVSAIDYPRPDGSSTFSDYTRFLGDRGAYFDISRESFNLLELPNLSALDEGLQQERFTDYQDFLLDILFMMVMGVKGDAKLDPYIVRSLLTLAMGKFFADYQIRKRYAAANTAGFGTSAWQDMPVLEDFIHYCSLERLVILNATPDLIEAIEKIKLRLRFWLESRVGKAISRPSTVKSDAQLLVLAMREISNDEDAAVLTSNVYMNALRSSLSAPNSIFFLDEGSVLSEYDSLISLVARLFANGAKSGIRMILSSQDPDSIALTESGTKILQNMTTRLVGRIQPNATDSFVRLLKYPREIIARNAAESFYPKKHGLYSEWLLDDLLHLDNDI